jgi:hypothetical protein
MSPLWREKARESPVDILFFKGLRVLFFLRPEFFEIHVRLIDRRWFTGLNLFWKAPKGLPFEKVALFICWLQKKRVANIATLSNSPWKA